MPGEETRLVDPPEPQGAPPPAGPVGVTDFEFHKPYRLSPIATFVLVLLSGVLLALSLPPHDVEWLACGTR
jgi:hypothetical protein